MKLESLLIRRLSPKRRTWTLSIFLNCKFWSINHRTDSWNNWVGVQSSPICVGTKCPSANPFTYSYCCGAVLNDCCIWIQVGFLKAELFTRKNSIFLQLIKFTILVTKSIGKFKNLAPVFIDDFFCYHFSVFLNSLLSIFVCKYREPKNFTI